MSMSSRLFTRFLFVAMLVAAPGARAADNYQGLWWNPAESGWGINLSHQGEIIFATWFTYDADGNPWWLVATLRKGSSGAYAGPLSTISGPRFGSNPFGPSPVAAESGNATISFADARHATLEATISGKKLIKAIVPQEFGPLPTCTWNLVADFSAATNFTGLWWNSAESGWGINLTHQGDTIFATWFTYDASGHPAWLVATLNRSGISTYAGKILRTTGPAFDSASWASGQVSATEVGSAAVSFAHGGAASFSYSVGSVSETKAIARQVFNGYGTVCVDPLTFEQRRKDGARFARQATFGMTPEAVNALVATGYSAWLEEQFALPTVSHLATVKADPDLVENPWKVAMPSLWAQYITGRDQLRQRVSYALSQIYVVSTNNANLGTMGCGMAYYFDILNRHAFGNLRDLLVDVTLSPAMGEFLSMKQSTKGDPVLQTQPDENFARELMQLFTVGLVLLNEDGTPQLDAQGRTIPTFDEDVVKGFAKALSGWGYSGQDQTKPFRWIWPDLYDPDPAVASRKQCPAQSQPMEPWLAKYPSVDGTRTIDGPAHDTGTKKLMSYAGATRTTIPAGQTPRADLENVIDNVFNHPNVGPFVSSQLIKRLITSNPSPQYVQRVARRFNDNGSGVRGDLKAVIRAILLDDEARSLLVAAQPGYGKLSEPVVRFVQYLRSFDAKSTDGKYTVMHLDQPEQLNQSPFRAPSVFNFYDPSYVPAGPMASRGLVGPEFEITTTAGISGFSSFSKWAMIRGFGTWQDGAMIRNIAPDYSRYLPLADYPAQLVDALEFALCGYCVDAQLKASIAAAVGGIQWGSDNAMRSQERLYAAAWLILNSPDYVVQK